MIGFAGRSTRFGTGKARLWRLAVAAALPMIVAAAAPDRSGLHVIDSLESGRWQLTQKQVRNGQSAIRRTVCLPDKGALIQAAHPDAQCSRFIIANQPKTGTVHYTCPGKGHGRTTLKQETPRLVQIDTQGMWNGMPFKMTLDAQKVGECRKH
tara:strand:+ start:491 stop:949 length:459 start_codon:yes stop_codon:yes gene_type:complete